MLRLDRADFCTSAGHPSQLVVIVCAECFSIKETSRAHTHSLRFAGEAGEGSSGFGGAGGGRGFDGKCTLFSDFNKIILVAKGTGKWKMKNNVVIF